eukprot:gene40532-64452_t
MAFVFGTERRGISDEVIELSDELVKIPMYGFTESFNISVSVALVLNTIRTRLEESNLNWKLSEEELVDLKIKWYEIPFETANGWEVVAKNPLKDQVNLQFFNLDYAKIHGN